MPTNKPQGEVWLAVNRTGGWSLEIKTTNGIPDSKSLCLAFRVGIVTSQNWDTLKSTLGNVPASGHPSPNTQEAFTCRVWVKDALLALHNASVIRLLQAIATIEQEAIRTEEENRTHVELGSGSAVVWNVTGFSATS